MKPEKKPQPLAIGEVIVSASQRHGDDFKRYRVLRQLGTGGYSFVYEVEDVTSGQRFAMKVLQLLRAKERRTLERFRREGPILFRVRHKNVVHSHDYGVRDDGVYWILLDLLVGRTLREVKIAMGGRISVPVAVEIALEVCAGLAAIHGLNILHRDIKPENIHVSDDGGMVRLIDLGAAKDRASEFKTTDGFTIGTFAYMSPEQTLAQDLDPSSDVFSMGTMLYELLAGVHPFEHDGRIDADVGREVGEKVINADPVPLRDVAPHVPKDLAQVVHKCIRKEKAARYPSGDVLYRILSAALEVHRAKYPMAGTLMDVMATLKQRAPMTGDVRAFPASPNPFVTNLGAEASKQEPAEAPAANLPSSMLPPPGPDSVAGRRWPLAGVARAPAVVEVPRWIVRLAAIALSIFMAISLLEAVLLVRAPPEPLKVETSPPSAEEPIAVRPTAPLPPVLAVPSLPTSAPPVPGASAASVPVGERPAVVEPVTKSSSAAEFAPKKAGFRREPLDPDPY